jgi:hypothetical protein
MYSRTRTVADPTSRGRDSSVSEGQGKYYKKGWFDLDENGQMTVSKVTGVGKNGCRSIARVIYSGQDGQGREHPAVWVDISDAQSVTGFNDAMSVFKASLKDRKKTKVPAALVGAPVTESSTTKPRSRSQQSIFDELLATANATASQTRKTVTPKEYSNLWEQAGVIHAQNSTFSRRTSFVSVQ